MKKLIRRVMRKFMGLFGPGVKFDTSHHGKMPTRGSDEAAALDLYASISYTILPGKRVKVQLGIKSKFNPGWAACIWDRSGMGSRGIHRFAGLIDSDYRGYWSVVLYNSTLDDVVINRGDRVAQVTFQRCWIGKPRRTVIYDDTERGSGGFGSTGN